MLLLEEAKKRNMMKETKPRSPVEEFLEPTHECGLMQVSITGIWVFLSCGLYIELFPTACNKRVKDDFADDCIILNDNVFSSV